MTQLVGIGKRATALVVSLGLVFGLLAFAPPSDGITLAPALAGATAVRSGQAVDVGGQIELDGSSFINAAALVGYGESGDEVARQDVAFGLNRTDGEAFLDVDPDGNVTGRIQLACEYGDATSEPVDRVLPACEGQAETAWDVQLEVAIGDRVFASDLLRVDPISPVVEGYEVTSPTTVVATFSEAITHPTGTESSSDWTFRDGEATVVGVQRGTEDCEYGPGEDPRSGASGCTYTLTVTPALPRDATPRIDYFPRTRGLHVDGADNTVYLRSVGPSRGDRADSLAADGVGPLPPTIDTIGGTPATDPDTGERLVLGNDPQPTVGLVDVTDGDPVAVQIDGADAGSATAGPAGASVPLDAPLADGVYAVTATAEDSAACDPNDPESATCSNDSEPSGTVTYDLDTVAPAIAGDVLARSSSISVALTEAVSGVDDAAQWSVSNPSGTPVSVDAVTDDGDGSAARRLSISGGPVLPDAELTYTPPVSDGYADEHGNPLAAVTVPLVIADLPVATVASIAGDETPTGLLGETTPVTFTINLSEAIAIGESAEVSYRLVPLGTATVGTDVEDTTGTVAFAATDDSAEVTVEVLQDELDEFDESVVFELFDPVGLRLPGDAATSVAIEVVVDDDPLAQVDFVDPSPEVAEGESVEITVALDGVSGKDVRVDWTTVFDLSATTDDAPEQSGTVTIPAGTTEGSFTVTTLPDLEVESGERLALELLAPVNVEIPAAGGRVPLDIVDDDVLVPLATVTGGEVDEDAVGQVFLVDPGTLAFTVELSESVGRTVRVDFATTTNGTATEGTEFTTTEGTLEFEPGDTALVVEVPIADDDLDEPDETVELQLSNPDGVVFTDAALTVATTGTIIDDDPLVRVAFADAELSVDEGESATFTLELDTASAKTVEVDWATRFDGSADGNDLPAQQGTVTFPAGDTSATFTVTTTQDDLAEDDEDLTVVLEPAFEVALDEERPTEARLTIADDEIVLPTLTVVGGTIGEDGATLPLLAPQLTWDLTLSDAADVDVTVDFRMVAGGTATAESDYEAESGTITIPADETTAQITAAVIDDALDEFDETVLLVLSNADNARLAGGAPQVGELATITDDDGPVTVSLGEDVEVAEGDPARIDVTLDAVSGKDVTVSYATVDGSATEGDDYVASTGELTIRAGATATSFTVPTSDDASIEGDEQLTVELTVESTDAAVLGDGTAVLTIVDDDLPLSGDPVLSLTGAVVDEGDPFGPPPLLPTTTLTFELQLSAPADGPVEVEYATADGTATSGDDYQATTGSVTIPDEGQSATIEVGVFADAIDEFDEDLTLSVTAVTGNAQLPEGGLARVGRVLDDDPLATVAFTDATAAVTVTEGGTAELTIEVEGATEKDVTVRYATSLDGDASSDDVPSQSGTVTVPAGSSTATFTIDTTQDDLEEDDEQLSVVLSSPGNAELDDVRPTVAALTIEDDELSLPTLTIDGGVIGEAEGALAPLQPAQLVWTLTLSEPAPADVTARFRTATGGSATAESDYTARSGSVTIAQDALTAEVTVDVLDDDLDEFVESVLLVLSDVEGARLPGDATQVREFGRITDDDDPVTVSLGDDVEVPEGDPVVVDVALDAVSGKDVTVSYATADDSAVAADDYDAATGQLTIRAGDTAASFTLATRDDADVEGDEQFRVELTVESTDAATLGDGTAVLTITDDDLPLSGDPVVSLTGAAVDEGDPVGPSLLPTTTMAFQVTLNADADGPVEVSYVTTGASATDGEDFEGQDASVTIADGQRAATIEVGVFPDAVDEPDEDLVLSITGVTGNAQLPEGGLARRGRILDDDPLATIAFTDGTADVGVTEGDSVQLTVQLEGDTAKDVTVTWRTSFDDNASPDDAAQQSGTVTVPAGAGTASFTIDTLQDDVDEPSERFSVVLSGPSNATLDDGRSTVATVTVNDDDLVAPVLDVVGGAVDEGAAGELGPLSMAARMFAAPDAGTAAAPIVEEQLVFAVSLRQAAEEDVTFDFRTVDTGSAVAGSDYVAVSGRVTIPQGETSAEILVDVLDDALDEFDELVVLRVSNARGVVLSNGESTLDEAGTITDDDPLVVVDLGPDAEVDEGEPVTLQVTLDAASGKAVELRLRTRDGTADAGDDYRAVDRTLTIPAGQTTASVTVTTFDDSTFEADETLDVLLDVVAADTATAGRSAARLTVLDDDLTVNPNETVVSLTGAAVEEGDPLTVIALPLDTVGLDFLVRLSRPADGDVTIAYRTEPGSATAGEDFTSDSGEVTIPDGQDRATITVAVLADTIDEFDEDLRLVLTDVSGDAVLPDGELARTGRILDDDPAALLRVADATVLEGGTAELDVTLDTASGKDISVDWALVDGSATAGEDFTADSGTLEFPAGTTSRTVTVTTLADDVTETIEQLELVLSTATNADIDDGRGTVSIVDLSAGITAVFLEDTTTREADGDRTALVPVRLSNERAMDTTVTWSTQALTATDGEDYRAEGGQVVIPAGATSAQIPITIVGDDEVEGNEDLLVLLTEADGALITGPTGRVTIEDDDSDDDTSPPDGGPGQDGPDGSPSPDDDEDGDLAATGGGFGLAVLGLGALLARRRRD